MTSEAEHRRQFADARKKGYKPRLKTIRKSPAAKKPIPSTPPIEPIVTTGAGTSIDITTPSQGSDTEGGMDRRPT